MTRKRAAQIDDDPPEPAKPTDHDVDHLMRLLSWARANGYRLGPTVQIGTVIANVADLRQLKREGLEGSVGEVDAGPYAEHGLSPHDVPADGTG